MALDFNSSNSERVTSSLVGDGGANKTFACWFRADSTTGGNQALVGEYDSGGNSGRHFLQLANATLKADWQGQVASASGSISAATWHHGAAVFRSDSDRSVFLDGGNKGDNTSTSSALTVDTTAIGRRNTSTIVQYFDGAIAEAACWTVDLTDAEIALLAAGVSPALVRPDKLAWYEKLIRPGVPGSIGMQSIGGSSWGEMGFQWGTSDIFGSPTSVDHPPKIIYPKWRVPKFAVAAPVTRTATAAVTLGGLSVAASGSVTDPSYTATASPTLGGLQASGSGTFTAPVYTATASPTLGGLEVTVTGTVTDPFFTATAALTLGGLETSITAQFDESLNTGTAALTLGALTGSGTGTFTAPVYTATAALTLGGLEVSASGTFSATVTGTAAVTLGGLSADASATFAAPVYTGTAALTLGGLEAAATAMYADAMAAAAVTLGALTVTASGPGLTGRFLLYLAETLLATKNAPIVPSVVTGFSMDPTGLLSAGRHTVELTYVDQYGTESARVPIEVVVDGGGVVVEELMQPADVRAIAVAGGSVRLRFRVSAGVFGDPGAAAARQVRPAEVEVWQASAAGVDGGPGAGATQLASVTVSSSRASYDATYGPFTDGSTVRLWLRSSDGTGGASGDASYSPWTVAPLVVADATGPDAPTIISPSV